MDVLYVGSTGGSSGHRAQALRRLGHRVHIVNPRTCLPTWWWVRPWTWRTGALFLGKFVRRNVLAQIPPNAWAICLVDSGGLVGPGLARELKRRCGTIVNYNVDDPYGRRDGRRWRLYLRALPLYDLVVVVREVNVAEALARGARNVLRVYMSADEEAHAPRQLTAEDQARWSNEVVFAGAWMPERGPFLEELVRLGVPISVFGDGWHKAAEWPSLRAVWRGPMLRGDDYVRALRGAKVCLGLLSKGNRDLHTQRSIEIPFAGGVLCAERTSEHLALYREGDEATFWSDAAECAERCRELLSNSERRTVIAERGRQRCVANGHLNERVMERVLCEALRS